MNETIEYLKSNISNLLFCMNLIEGIGCTYAQTEEILERGTCEGIPPNEIQKMINFKRALEFLESESRYPVELGSLMQYNSIIGDGDLTHANPGYVRDDREVRISHCNHTIPPISEPDALYLVNDYWNYEDVFDQCAYLATVLPKTQIFYNGNKRTSLLACNQLLCYNDTRCIFMLETEDKYLQYISTLLSFYNDEITQQEAMDSVKCFIS